MTWPCPPSVPPVAIESQTSHGTTTVFVSGELDLVTMPILREYLTPILRGRPKRLILELSGIKFIDCGSARPVAATRAATGHPPAPAGRAQGFPAHRPGRLLRDRRVET
jgi:hypothetical protein